MAMQLGVPLKLLKEFLSRKITVETSSGESFRGILLDAEENMSVSLGSVKATLADGKSAEMVSVYIKGSRVRLISLPDSAKDSLPSLTRPFVYRGRGGRGGGFRGGRGGGNYGGGRRRDGPSESSYERRRY